MATRRMFSKEIVCSSSFLMMPATSRLLYYDLGMSADDDGFCEYFGIMRMTEARPDDLKILAAKNFIKIFDDKILVILDWKENNYIQKDRYRPSRNLEIYKDEVAKISHKVEQLTLCIQPVSKTDTQDRLGKDRLGKDNNTFTPPSAEAVKNYCLERKNSVDPEQFINFYQSKGWMVGKNKMKDWQAAVRTWEKTSKQTEKNNQIITLHDGSKAICKFGIWVDATRPEIKINTAFYPELKNM